MLRRIVLLATALVLLAAAPATAESPVRPDNKPTPVEGYENGRLPASRLITVLPGCRTVREAAPSGALLFRQAAALNVPLFGNDCYRPLDDQVTLYARNTSTGGPCTAQPTYYPDGRPRGTSNHGWGKAIDFGNTGGPLNFSSVGYRFLKSHAARVGWNHPGWAEPGQPCAEPWHWEWVGDGGTMRLDSVRSDVVSVLPSADEKGVNVVTALGDVQPRASAKSLGSAIGVPLNWVIVGAANTPSRSGYWLLGADGGIFSYGDASFFGSTGDRRLNRPVVTMAPTPDGGGYWLAAGDGGMFTFGNAGFFGSSGSMKLNSPVVGMTPTADGGGYWLVAADGGIFTFGNATFFGSTGDLRLSSPIVGMAATPSGRGYWLVGADGGIFTFGDAGFFGSGADRALAQPVVAMHRTANGDGYWLVTADGSIVARGSANPL
ncbi:MAG TPA: M15 family metallopeptidase [Acidimicrobiales bacterium]|nr:M15 family metallopeptidase [Acidimicrobiales bacterium]